MAIDLFNKKNKITPFYPEKDSIQRYKKIRSLGQNLNSGMLECKELELDIKAAGRKLNLLEGNTFVFEDEHDMDIVMDFALYEIFTDNKNYIEQYYELDLPETVDENIILEAELDAFTSLFEVIEIDKLNCTILLKDILETEHVHSVIDIGFSQTGMVGMIMFTRIIPMPEFNITGGVSFVFQNEFKQKLLSGYGFLKFKHKNKVKSADKYLYFYNQKLVIGNKVHTQNI